MITAHHMGKDPRKPKFKTAPEHMVKLPKVREPIIDRVTQTLSPQNTFRAIRGVPTP
jgi:hypothetical protein